LPSIPFGFQFARLIGFSRRHPQLFTVTRIPFENPQSLGACLSTMNEEPLLNRPQVAAILGVSLRTVDALIAAGELPCVRIGRCVCVRPSSVDRFIEARETRANVRLRRRRGCQVR